MNTDAKILKEFIEKSLAEMPIQKFEKIGDFSKNRSFKEIDRAILNSEPGLKRIHKQFSKTPFDFHFYVMNHKEANRRPAGKMQWTDILDADGNPTGQVNGDYLETVPTLKEVGVVTPEFVKKHLKIDVPETDDVITVLFNGNNAAEKVMFTSWTMAHRIGHALAQSKSDSSGLVWGTFMEHFDTQIGDVLNVLYDVPFRPSSHQNRRQSELIKHFLSSIGTFKSARDGNLRSRFEFHYELLAQYLITGKIKFKPLQREFITKTRFAWGNPAHEKKISVVDEETFIEIGEKMQTIENDCEYLLRDVMNECLGKIFLM